MTKHAMRAFYSNHRDRLAAARVIERKMDAIPVESVHLLAGLDFFMKYGPRIDPAKEKLIHELLDLDYLIAVS